MLYHAAFRVGAIDLNRPQLLPLARGDTPNRLRRCDSKE